MRDMIQMPELPGEAPDGTIRRWLKREGDAVGVGDVIALVDTERGVVELASNREGTLGRILVPAGKTAAPGTPLAELAAAEEGIPKAAPAPSAEKPAALGAGGVRPILMPKAGNDMEEGMLIRWAVSEGDRVKVGMVLFEIETDKATLEVESEFEGTVRRIVVNAGETVPVHTPLAYLADSDAALEAFLAAQGGEAGAISQTEETAKAPAGGPQREVSTAAAAETAAGTVSAGEGRVHASPAARKMAAEGGLDLEALAGRGSGPGGRILSGDLARAGAVSGARQPVAAKAQPAHKDPEGTVRKPMTPMRRAIARNLTQSAQTIPHFFMKTTVRAEQLEEMYRRLKPVIKVSFNDLLLAAVAHVMTRFPTFRCQVHGEEFLEFASCNIGMAVAVEDGLRVPVMMGVDKMTLVQLAQETKRVIQEARNGKSANAGKGTFTISNLGMTDTEEFTAIINPPESAILAVGKITDGVRVEQGEIHPVRLLSVWLSSNHRVIDGITAARFLAELRKVLEAPEVLERNEK